MPDDRDREYRSDDEVVRWRQLNRELDHLWRILDERKAAMDLAIKVKADELRALSDQRMASLRLLVSVAAVLVTVVGLIIGFLVRH